MSADQHLVDRLDEVWQSIAELGDGLSEAEWKTETECPGWSLQDNVSHLIGIESTLLDIPLPEHSPPDGPHLKNDIGRMNEIAVDVRRDRNGAEVLDEFREITRRRIDILRGLDDDGFAAESWTPAGPGTVRDLLPFRVFDSWVHEQDMRRAVGRPGDVETPAGDLAMGRVVNMLPFVVGKKVKPGDGTTVAFDVTGPGGRPVAVGVEGGRGKALADIPSDPKVRLTLDTDTLVRLTTGRGDPDEILAAGAVRFEGDEALGRRVVAELNCLF